MRPISRTALGAATAAVLAVTVIAPSVAAPPDERDPNRPVTGSAATAAEAPKPVTVTLVTGDTVLVTTDASGASAATALPRADGSVPLVQTRQSGPDLYVYPESAVSALAEGTVDEELFNVTGLIRQGYDDSHADAVPLIATYGGDTARRAPLTPRGAERGAALDVIDGLALKADKKRAAEFWTDLTAPAPVRGPGSRSSGSTARFRPVSTSRRNRSAPTSPGPPATTGPAPRSPSWTPGRMPNTPTSRAGSPHRRTSPTPAAQTTARATAPMSRPPSAAPARRAEERTRASHPAPT